jgi:peptide chain release factor 1
MTLSQKTGDSDLSKLNEMRKQIANNSQQVKLYQEFRELFVQLSECAEIVQKETDQELKQLAKAEMEELQESVVAHSQDIVEVIIPKVDADKRDC